MTETDSAGLEATYRLEADDLTKIMAVFNRPAWGARHWGRHEQLRLVLAGISLAGLCFLLLKVLVARLAEVDLIPWSYGLGVVGAGAFMGWKWGEWKSRPLPPDNPLLQERSLRLEASGFAIKGSGFDTRIEWASVADLRAAGGYLLFRTRWNDLHALPLRVFPSPEAASAFVAKATELRRSAIRPPGQEPPHPPTKRLRYRLTRDDVRAFFALSREKQGWRAALFYLLLFPVMAGVVRFEQGADDATWWTGLALGLVGTWLLSALILLIDKQIAIARHPLAEGETELQRWGDHLAVIADGGTELVPYELIGNVVTTERHIFVMTKPDRAIIVPLHAFTNAAEMRAFGDRIDRLSKESVP